MGPRDVAIAFAAKAALLPGVKVSLRYDPEELQGLPAVTLSYTRTDQADRFTGPATENVWHWIVRLYVPLGTRLAGSDFELVDDLLYDLVPRLFKVVRDDPGLSGACIKCELSDPGDEPERDVENGRVVKLLQLRATTEEI